MKQVVQSFRTGQLHVTYALPFGKVDVYRRNSSQLLRTDPYLNTYFFRLNVRHPPLSNERANGPRRTRPVALG